MTVLTQIEEGIAPARDTRSFAQRVLSTLEQRSDLELGALIFLLSFGIRCLVMYLDPHAFEFPRAESVNVATSLALNGTFANPFRIAETGPTAHVAPVNPFLLSLLIRAYYARGYFPIAMHLFAAVCVSLQFGFLPYCARAFRLPRSIGILTAILASIVPMRMFLEVSGVHEVAISSFVCIAMVSWTFQQTQSLPRPAWQKILCGIAWGFAFLLSPVFALILAGMLVALALTTPVRPLVSYTSYLFVFSLLTISPWLVRNYIELGAFSPIRDNFGLEFSVSNDDIATPVLELNMKPETFRHPFSNREECLKMKAIGETAYYRLRMHEAVDWIRSHPARFRQLTALRIAYFWFRPSTAPAIDFFPFIWPLLGAYGLVLLWPQNRPVAAVILAMWICSQLPYLFVQVSPRYRYPIDWSLLLMSMFAIREIVRQHQPPAAEPSRV
jgi:hypothetical protein